MNIDIGVYSSSLTSITTPRECVVFVVVKYWLLNLWAFVRAWWDAWVPLCLLWVDRNWKIHLSFADVLVSTTTFFGIAVAAHAFYILHWICRNLACQNCFQTQMIRYLEYTQRHRNMYLCFSGELMLRIHYIQFAYIPRYACIKYISIMHEIKS